MPLKGRGTRDLSVVLNAVARSQPCPLPTKQAPWAGPQAGFPHFSSSFSLRYRAQRGRHWAAGDLVQGLPLPGGFPGRRAATRTWAVEVEPAPLCAPPPQLPASAPPPARSRPSAPEARVPGAGDGEGARTAIARAERGAAWRGHGRGVPCVRAAALQRPQAALPAAAGGVPRAQGRPRAIQG